MTPNRTRARKTPADMADNVVELRNVVELQGVARTYSGDPPVAALHPVRIFSLGAR